MCTGIAHFNPRARAFEDWRPHGAAFMQQTMVVRVAADRLTVRHALAPAADVDMVVLHRVASHTDTGPDWNFLLAPAPPSSDHGAAQSSS